jgi:hypothetical protein
MRTTIAVAVLTLGTLPAPGQESAAPPAALLHGATIAVQLKKTVKADKAIVGDEVDAGTSEPVLMQGRVVIPRGARVVGHVLAVSPYAKEHPESVLRIRFERAEWKQQSVPLNAFIVGQLGVKHKKHHASDCFPPQSQFLAQRTGDVPCATAGPESLDYIFVRNLEDPPGGTQLMSVKQSITLPAGTLIELRHSAR